MCVCVVCVHRAFPARLKIELDLHNADALERQLVRRGWGEEVAKGAEL